MQTATSHKQHLAPLSRVRRIHGQPGDLYEVIFVDRYDHIVVPLTEWYRLRKERGSLGTRNAYLTCLTPYLSFLIERGCPWNAPPEQLRPVLIAFHRDCLGCQIHPGEDRESMGIVPTRETPVQASTLRVMRAALRDFYLVMKEAGLYAFPNPLSSEVLVTLKRAHTRALANRGAPDQAGIREETREQSRRRPTAFLRHLHTQGWKPDLRKELSDVREGIHNVLNALVDSQEFPLREKVVVELLRTTGARLHEVLLMSVGGYRNSGVAGQAKVVDKGSYGCEIKTIYFAHNPRVEQLLTMYLEQERPLYDPKGRTQLMEVEDQEPLFLTKRETPYSVKSFYYHWYRHYAPLQNLCPVRFSPHDIRHLFVSEFLIKLKLECGAGTERFDSEQYLREREAFGSLVMGWRSMRTIDIYDQTRSGERTLQVLASYQQDLARRRFVSECPPPKQERYIQEEPVPVREQAVTSPGKMEPVWLHDEETLAWIKKMQHQTGER
jgi:hypothetical protein